jgi:signal transduction histidine kinase
MSTVTRLRILADAAAIVAASADYESALHHLAELVVPTIADWCAIDVVETDGMRRVAVAHPNRSARVQGTATEVHRLPRLANRRLAQAMATGKPQLVEISDELLGAFARDNQHLVQLRRLDLLSGVILPLVARGQALGAVTLARTANDRPFSDAELPFLTDLAVRAAIALDNLRLLQEAREAVRLRDDFLAMASHDMRTPLGAILGSLQLAQRKLPRVEGDVREDLARHLALAIRTTSKMARLVGELMDISMMRSGQPLPLKIESVDIVALLHEVASEHERQTDAHRIRVEGPDALVSTVDRTRLERVLDNIVGNAVKYSPEGGDISLCAEREGDAAVVTVCDEGIGIPADELEVIFDPYHRGSNATGLKGIGLGLAGAREVVRQLGGELTVESTQGSGSIFTIRLPL